MTISHDQMLCVHEGKAHVFVPYKPGALYNCGNHTCSFCGGRRCMDDPCFCTDGERDDNRMGYWKEANADIT